MSVLSIRFRLFGAFLELTNNYRSQLKLKFARPPLYVLILTCLMVLQRHREENNCFFNQSMAGNSLEDEEL